jgi:predicted ATPase
LLLRRWRQSAHGEGRVVLLSGEPGIGKSRLAVELQEQLQAELHTHLRHFCSPHHQDSALFPIISRLEREAGFRRGDTDQRRLDKLEAVLARATNDLGDAVPPIADLLSVSSGNRYPALDLTPQKRKQKTLRALLAQLEGLAAHQPVLTVFEDVHWIDPTSLELLDLIVDRVPTLPVLVIITCRPEFAPPWLGRPNVTLLTLNRLPPAQRAEMIVGVAGGKALPKAIVDQIIDHTDGVPLFIEELTKTGGCQERRRHVEAKLTGGLEKTKSELLRYMAPSIWNLLKRASDRIVAAVLAQPVGFGAPLPVALVHRHAVSHLRTRITAHVNDFPLLAT